MAQGVTIFYLGQRPAAPSSRLIWCAVSVFIVLAVIVSLFAVRTQRDQPVLKHQNLPTRTGSAAPAGTAAEVAARYDPRDIKPLSVPVAMAINASVPVAMPAVGAAARFVLDPSRPDLRETALQCLTAALYYEAGFESEDGQRAVAQVILNRIRHRAYPSSVCGVVYQGSTRATGCQFTFTCDGSLGRAPSLSAWARSRRLAEAALSGHVFKPVGHATHYHADYVVPYWAASLDKVLTVGRHIFYSWAGRNGTTAAFRQRYSQVEVAPSPSTLPTQVTSSPTLLPPGSPLSLDVVTVAISAAAPRALPAKPAPALVVDHHPERILLADREAGTLRLAPQTATKRTAEKTRLVDEPQCVKHLRVSPVQPGHLAAPGSLDERHACDL